MFRLRCGGLTGPSAHLITIQWSSTMHAGYVALCPEITTIPAKLICKACKEDYVQGLCAEETTSQAVPLAFPCRKAVGAPLAPKPDQATNAYQQHSTTATLKKSAYSATNRDLYHVASCFQPFQGQSSLIDDQVTEGRRCPATANVHQVGRKN